MCSESLMALKRHTRAAETMTTLDICGCTGVTDELRSREGITKLFPHVTTFVVQT